MYKVGIFRLFLLLGLVAVPAALLSPGCDKLVTEVNNNNIFDTTLAEDCLRCHGDSSNLIVQPKGQWENSRHASPALIEATININGSDYQTNLCGPTCHTSEGFISYAQTGQATPPASPSVINCYTCHMPHSGPYGSWSIDTLRGYVSPQPMLNGEFYEMGRSNMCVPCHQAAQPVPLGGDAVAVGADFGPHYGAQADVVSGTGGYDFGLSLDTVTHRGIASLNGCLACHYGTGVGYEFGEHTFRVENHSTGQQYVGNCNVSGCHSSNAITNFYESDIIDSIALYAGFLEDSLKSRMVLDPSDTAGIALVTDSTVPTLTAQVLYNYLLYRLDGSRGVHNPVYMRNLLRESVVRWDSIPPLARIAVSDSIPCAGVAVTFLNQTVGNDTAYFWKFGDPSDSTSTEENPVYAYPDPGTYTVTFVATGPGGSDSTTFAIVVRGAPTIAFTADTTAGCNNLTVTFVDQSSGGIDRQWAFGDGGQDVVAQPTHTYAAPGFYAVTLKVSNDCGVDSLIKADFIRIYATPPVAGFAVDVASADTSHTFQFTDQSTDAESWQWNFGDQTAVSTEENPTHKFAAAGAYMVWLKVINPCGIDSVSQEITVTQP